MAQSFIRSFSLKLCLCLCVIGTLYLLVLSNDYVKRSKLSSGTLSVKYGDGSIEDTTKSKPFILDTFLLQKDDSDMKSRYDIDGKDKAIDIVTIFTRAYENRSLKRKFWTCLTTLFSHTASPLSIHVITDEFTLPSAKKILAKATSYIKGYVQVHLYHVEAVVRPIEDIVSYMQPHFSYKPGAYYSDSLFFLSIAIYKVFRFDKLIMLDVDTKFLTDITQLYSYFENFGPDAVIGIAWEQQPVYRHLLHEYRTSHPDTKAGGVPPLGFPGFNSGVLLMDLKKMERSPLYQRCINSSTVEDLTKKYRFKGHLGDQDFYSLISFEHPELFYVLPCGWNRQLCHWWKDHGYEDVFYEYYNCTDTVKLYHGNCNSNIPL